MIVSMDVDLEYIIYREIKKSFYTTEERSFSSPLVIVFNTLKTENRDIQFDAYAKFYSVRVTRDVANKYFDVIFDNLTIGLTSQIYGRHEYTLEEPVVFHVNKNRVYTKSDSAPDMDSSHNFSSIKLAGILSHDVVFKADVLATKLYNTTKRYLIKIIKSFKVELLEEQDKLIRLFRYNNSEYNRVIDAVYKLMEYQDVLTYMDRNKSASLNIVDTHMGNISIDIMGDTLLRREFKRGIRKNINNLHKEILNSGYDFEVN